MTTQPISTLPPETHDHFRKANILHGYVEESLGTATKHALETGVELLAAKDAIPHGSWESECARLFNGSLRAAQFYMQFEKHISTLPKAQASALLILESTLEGAAKAAKKAANPKPPKSDDAAIDVESSEVDYGICPNCRGTNWTEDKEGVYCTTCHHPWGGPVGDTDNNTKTAHEAAVMAAQQDMKRWSDAVGRWMAPIDEYRDQFPDVTIGDRVIKIAKDFFNATEAWRKAIK